MEYREIGKTGVKASPLGFGVMRLPMKNGGATANSTSIDVVDVDASIDMILHAIHEGVNYFDTAYNYVSGNSEVILGKALATEPGLREKVIITSKSPAWLYKEPEDFDKFLNTQLQRLGTDYLDFYIIHSLNGGSWKRTQRINALESLKRAKADGRVRHIGFSFHDDPDLFREILDAADWDMCQIQLNYFDQDYQAGVEGAKLAHDRGIGVVIMEPLRGGLLAQLPASAQAAFDSAPVKRSNAEWALDWLWDMDCVDVVLSGMSTMDQLTENIASMKRARVGMFTPEDTAAVDAAKAALDAKAAVPCTGCNYCVEYCPVHVAIPYNFRAYNMGALYDDEALAREYYEKEVTGFGKRAEHCVSCGTCEEMCPQHIAIGEWMPKIHELLGE